MINWFNQILFQTYMYSARPAIVLEDRTVTYEMLGLAIERCARKLTDSGLNSERPVGILVQNPIRNITLSLALFYLGIPSIVLVKGIADLKELNLQALLIENISAHETKAHNQAIPITDDWFAIDQPFEKVSPKAFPNENSICRISLTSGTTGLPKAVALSERELGARISEKIFCGLEAATGRAVLCMLGLSSSVGLSSALAALTLGRTVVIPSDPGQAIRMIELYSVDSAFLSTEQLLVLTRTARYAKSRMTSLKVVTVSGSSPSSALVEMASQYFCRDIRFRYSSTETGLVAIGASSDMQTEPGFVGFIIPGVKVGIFDNYNAELNPGEVGLVKVHRPDLADSYGDTLVHGNGWIGVGDIGWRSANNGLYIIGRTTDGQIDEKWHSQSIEVEHILRLEWHVTDVACVFIKSDGENKTPLLAIAIVDKGILTNQDLEKVALKRGISTPITLKEVSAIPRGVNGKVDRQRLKAIFSDIRTA